MRRIPALLALLLVVSVMAAACGDDGGDGPNGRALFQSACQSCHGSSGGGGLGPALRGNPFIAGTSDADLKTLIAAGRPSTDPANTSGVSMPGFPFDAAELDAVVAHLRSLNG